MLPVLILLLNFKGTSTKTNYKSQLTIPITAGAVGGAALIIIISLCIVILYVRKSQIKRLHVNNKMATELNSDESIHSNPNHNTAELDIQNRKQDEHLYDYVTNNESLFQAGNEQNTLRMEYNPSYGRAQGSNTADCNTSIVQHSHPYYNVISTTGIPEDEYYVEADPQYHSYTDVKGYLEIIGSTTGITTKIN